METEEQLKYREWARYFFGACDDGSVEPDDALWNIEEVPIATLAALYQEGADVFLDAEIAERREEYGQDPHWCDFLKAENFEQYLEDHCDFPCVISIDENEVIQVWDGWHRIACVIVRGEASMKILVGRVMQPTMSMSM